MKNPLAIAAVRQQSPYIAVGLYDMIDIIASELRSTWDDYQRHLADLDNACRTQSPGGLVSEQQKKTLADLMDDVVGFAVSFGFKEAGEDAIKVREQVDDGLMARNAPATIEVVCDLMQDLDGSLRRAMLKKKLIFMPPDKDVFLNQPSLFGPLVNKKIPTAMLDIRAAGNCLALDLNTAAVFHLMRSVEHGMRSLAARLDAKFKGRAIESLDWGKLITAINAAINLRRHRFDKSKRKKKGEFNLLRDFDVLTDEMNVFRVIYRNDISHTGKPCEEQAAMVVYHKVKDFMQRLAIVLKK